MHWYYFIPSQIFPSLRHTIKGYGSAFGEKYGNADRVEVACAALVRHGYSYVGKVRNVNVNVLKSILLLLLLLFFLQLQLQLNFILFSYSCCYCSSSMVFFINYAISLWILLALFNVDTFTVTVGHIHFRYIRWAVTNVYFLRPCFLSEAEAHGNGQNACKS